MLYGRSYSNEMFDIVLFDTQSLAIGFVVTSLLISILTILHNSGMMAI